MDRLNQELIKKCRVLRNKGYSLGEVSDFIEVPKSTLYGHVKDMPLSSEQKNNIAARIKERNKNRVNPRKGKCLPGREILKPKLWSEDLVHIVAHFMFDGMVNDDSCIYYSKDKSQIFHMRKLLYKAFKIRPEIKLRDNGVFGLPFYHVEFAEYVKKRKEWIISYINNGASYAKKRIFLKAFFDDEGCVFYKGDKKRVRGYQKSIPILKKVRNLLATFSIESRIDKEHSNIEITGYNNLTNFAKEINFSPRIYMNPERKNSIWKKRISKKRILDILLESYSRKKD